MTIVVTLNLTVTLGWFIKVDIIKFILRLLFSKFCNLVSLSGDRPHDFHIFLLLAVPPEILLKTGSGLVFS
jgi:hypothetical protein